MPDDLGFNEVRDGAKALGKCFEAIHTHDETGTLHIDFVADNDLNIASFLTRWFPQLNLQKVRIQVNGQSVSDPASVVLQPEMDIKIFL